MMDYLRDKLRYMMAEIGGGGRLPSDYQEVEYIGTQGQGQEFITYGNFDFHGNDEIEIGVSTNSTTLGEQGFFGGSGQRSSELYFNRATINAWGGFLSSQSGMTIQAHTKIDFSAYTSYNFSITLNIFTYRVGSYNFNGNIYYLRIIRDDETLLDLVPCYRKSDREIGMYDMVSEEFYTNDGTGQFIKGADV